MQLIKKGTFESPLLGVILNFESIRLVQMIAHSGFDFILLDAEHGPLTPPNVEAMVRVANGLDLTVYMRTPGPDQFEIQRYLDLGIQGIQVPHVDTAVAAANAVSFAFYPPKGRRGLSTSTPAASFGAKQSAANYVAEVNRTISVFATVESYRAVADIDNLVAVEGLAGVAIGTGDMALSMGLAGQRTAPEVQEAASTIIAACKKADKQVMLPASNLVSARAALKLGVTGIQFPASALFIEPSKQLLAGVHAALNEKIA
jgi:4-hydroxy-2-oxoheptanedioate aldolase